MEHGVYKGFEVPQSPQAFEAWRFIVAVYKPDRIVELGTGRGVFSCFLRSLVGRRSFFTFDRVPRFLPEALPEEEEPLDDNFHQADIFKRPREVIQIMTRPGRTLLFCDNGNKVHEWELFGPRLKDGDMIAVHDWRREIVPDDVQAGVEEWGLVHAPCEDPYTCFWLREEVVAV